MNRDVLIPLIIGLFVGILAIGLGYMYVNKVSGKNSSDLGPTDRVVIAKEDLSAGEVIDKNKIAVVNMPKNLIPKGAVKDPKEVLGKAVKEEIVAKMPILSGMVGPGKGLEGIIPEGYRAVTVQVDEFTGVAGLLRPGAHVDVVGTFKVRDDKGRTDYISKLILQNVEVRAVGQNYTEKDADSPKAKLSRSVTLLVKPEQVEKLQLAASTGKIRLALRPAFDNEPVRTRGHTLVKLLYDNPVSELDKDGSGGLFPKLLSLVFMKGGKNAQKDSKELAEKGVSKETKKEPFAVELIKGDTNEVLYFESPDSDKRVDPNAFAETSAAKGEQNVADKAGFDDLANGERDIADGFSFRE